ncbi:MAG TPA: PIG-L family deacetylase, partial [Clostridia bacterium]|nr:PIG-L family deacetylase [Clostridia bacterium]
GIIERAVARGIPLRVVFLTNGDFNERSFAVYRKHPVIEPRAVLAMGRIRRDEALAAAAILKVPAACVAFLGYPDFGTLQIWEAHWGERPPFESYLTEKTQVPYQHAVSFGAPYKGEAILKDLTDQIRNFQPTQVYVSHPADHHPDHRALFLFTQVALWNLGMQPKVFPYLIHRAGWPLPHGFHPEQPLTAPGDLDEVREWTRVPLPAAGVALKRKALEAHKTQFEYSAEALLSFARVNELFGAIPPFEGRTGNRVTMGGDTGSLSSNAPVELLETERGRFVSIAITAVRWDPSVLEIELVVDRWHPEVEVSLFVFPYRADMPFGTLPKLRIKLREQSEQALDQGQPLPAGTLELRRQGNQVRVRIPTRQLQDPEKLFLAAQSQLGPVPLDHTPWRTGSR